MRQKLINSKEKEEPCGRRKQHKPRLGVGRLGSPGNNQVHTVEERMAESVRGRALEGVWRRWEEAMEVGGTGITRAL